MSFLPGNAQHIGNRSSQQDSFGFGDPDDEEFLAHGGFVAVVCDGMGGMEHGDAASRMAVRAFLEAYQRKDPAESIPDALERSAREANDRVVEMAHELGAAESVGTTLVAAVLTDSRLGKAMYFISVGDSGLFHVSDGQMQTVNRPHIFGNLLDNAVARGSMTKEQALLHPERESLTSFIGVEVLEEIDRNVDPWPIADGDSILLASDGLFKTLSPDEILETLHGHPQSWPDALVARTLERKYEYQDNVTVLSVTTQDQPDTLKLPPPAVVLDKGVAPEITVMLPPPPKRSRKLVAAVLIVLAGIAIAGGGGWWYKKHHPAAVTEKK
jgi:serine/threonine protein phosphatase PrpC